MDDNASVDVYHRYRKKHQVHQTVTKWEEGRAEGGSGGGTRVVNPLLLCMKVVVRFPDPLVK